MHVSPEKAVEHIEQTDPSHHIKGSDALFIRIGEEWGLKLFKNENERDENYQMQKLVAETGLAPRVGNCFSINIDMDKIVCRRYGVDIDTDEIDYHRYGFVTECAEETFKDRYLRCHKYSHMEGMRDLEALPEYQELIDKLHFVGVNTNDMHWANIAYMKDGRMVAIDFSRAYENFREYV